MAFLKKIPTNYVTYFYLLNILLSISIAAFEYNKPVQYALSVSLILFFGFGGYLNAKKGKNIRSICWVFFFNLILGIGSIIAIEVLGATFNIFGGSEGRNSVLIVLFQYAINFYLVPFMLLINTVEETLLIIFLIFCSFIIPYFGLVIGRFLNTKKT